MSDKAPVKSTPICRHCKKPLHYAGQTACTHCGKTQGEHRSGEASHARRFATRRPQEESIKRQADKLLEHCGHCENDTIDSERLRELIRKFVTAGYDLETAKAMAYQAYHEDPNVVTPPKASFYPNDGGSGGGGGGISGI